MREVSILRDYQQQLVTEVFTSWKQGNRKVLLQLPTGGRQNDRLLRDSQLFSRKRDKGVSFSPSFEALRPS